MGSEDGELERARLSHCYNAILTSTFVSGRAERPLRSGGPTDVWFSSLLPRPLLVWAVRSAVFRQGEGPGRLQVGRWPQGLRRSLRGPLESAIPLSVAWQCPM